MPAPRPSMIASVGAISGTAVAPAPSVSGIMPPASAISALTSVRTMAATEPKTRVSTITATAIPISSPTGAGCWSIVSATGPRIATCSPSPSATRAAERVADGGDVWSLRDLPRGFRDRPAPVAKASLLGVEDDRGALVRGGGEAVLEQILGLLGLGGRHRELVRELPAERAGER